MKRENKAPDYIVHWIVIIFLSVAGTYLWNKYMPQEETIKKTREANIAVGDKATDFLIIHFPRIAPVKDEDSITVNEFQDDIRMLRRNGYNFIDLAQVLDYYEGKTDLPPKSVLITLVGFRQTYRCTKDILDGLHIRPTLFLDAEAMRESLYSHITWHDARNMVHENQYDLSLLARTTKNALDDQLYTERKLEGVKIQSVDCSSAVDINSIKGYFKLAFMHKVSDGINSRTTTPYPLNMLIVQPEWNTGTLNVFVRRTMSSRHAYKSHFDRNNSINDWLALRGNIFVRKGHLHLESPQDQSGAETWLLGIRQWNNATIEVDYKLIHGEQFMIYARYKNADNYIRFIQSAQKFYLQERINGRWVKTMKDKMPEVPIHDFHRIKFVIRDRYAFAYLNKQKLFKQALYVDPILREGKIGFAIWDSSNHFNHVKIGRVRIHKINGIWLDCSRNNSCVKKMRQYPDQISSVSPRWFHVVEGGKLTKNLWHLEAFQVIAGFYRMNLLPTVDGLRSIQDESELESCMEQLKTYIRKYKFTGINLDLTDLADPFLPLMFERLRADYGMRSHFKRSVRVNADQFMRFQEVLKSFNLVGLVLQKEESLATLPMDDEMKRKVFSTHLFQNPAGPGNTRLQDLAVSFPSVFAASWMMDAKLKGDLLCIA